MPKTETQYPFGGGLTTRTGGLRRLGRGPMHEYLLEFSCKCRCFCPSCHAKRLAIWTQWLDTTLLAPVPHRQVLLTIPKWLRAYCLYRFRLLGEIARVAARIVSAAIRSLTGEHELAVGIVACLHRMAPGQTGIRICTYS